MRLLRSNHCWIVPLLAVSLSACSLLGNRNDNSGDLGTTREARPGDVYAQMGQEYMKEGQPPVALRKLKHGLEVDPDNARVHAVLGRLYEQLGEMTLAEQHYLRATELEPKNAYFHNARGSFLCQQGHYESAETAFRQALQNPLYEQPWATQTNAGVCALRAGQTDVGERYLRQALQANPQIPLALFKLAQLLAERGEAASAAEYLARFEQLAGPTPASLLLGIQLARRRNDPAETTRLRRELEKHFPDAPETQTARQLP